MVNVKMTAKMIVVTGIATNLIWCVGCAINSPKLATQKVLHPIRSLVEKEQKKFDTKFNVARLHERNGNLSEAVKLYSQLLESKPQSVAVCNRLGVVCTRMSKHDDANKAFTKALELEPENVELLTDFGYSLYMRGDLSRAEVQLRKALQGDPLNERATNNLGIVKGQQGEFEESLQLFGRVVTPAEAHSNLGFIHVQRGEGKLAERQFSLALTLDKELESAALALVQLAEIKQHAETDRATTIAKAKPVAQTSFAQDGIASSE